MRIELLAILAFFGFGSPAFAQGSPIPLSALRCAKFLEEPPPVGHLKSVADEIVAFTSLTHPVLERVFEHSNDLDFMFDLVYLPTGWMLPPPSSAGRAFHHYQLSTQFDEGPWAFLRTSTPKSFQRRVERLGRIGAPGANEFKWKFVQEMLNRTLWMICHVANEQHRSNTTHNGRERHFNMSVLYMESRVPDQGISVNWTHSFADEDFARFSDLCYFSREESVIGEVLRQLNLNVDLIVRSQQRLVRELDTVTTAEEFRAARARLGSGPRPALVVPPPVVERAASTGQAFRDWKINAFLEKAAVDDFAWTLDDIDLRRTLAESHEALELVNGTLAHMSRWRRDDFDWKYFNDRFDPSVEWVEKFSGMIERYRRGSLSALEQYDKASRALERLQKWTDDRLEFLARATKDTSRVGALDPGERTTLESILSQLPRVSLVLRQALVGFGQQEQLNLVHISVVADVSALVSQSLQRTREGRLVDDKALRQSLRLLAQSAARRAQPE